MTLSQLLFTSDGRIGRKAWWFAVVVMFAAELVASLVDGALFDTPTGIVSTLVGIATLVSTIMVSVKRFHDRDKSGWWVLILLVPAIGFVWLLVENGCLRGTPGPNRFGPDPLGPFAPPSA